MVGKPRGSAMAWRTRIGLLLATLGLAVLVAGGVLWTTLAEAERDLIATLEGKARTHARIVRSDVELALELGIPLDLLPGAYDYLEGGAESDPDIRFVAITDPDLGRLHYGGIGRARLDPLLDTEAVRAAAASVATHRDQPLRSVTVEGFSLTPAPLFEGDRHAGFVVVAVQGRQIQEALLERLAGLLPAALALLVLLVELVAWTASSLLEEPWRRLRRMMARLVDGRRLLWSARHDKSELGMAMRLANGIFHRLKDQAERVAMRASEAERAVFDPSIARAVREHTAAFAAPPLAPLVTAPEQPADRRPSDVHAAIVLFVAAGAAGLLPAFWPYLWPALLSPPTALWLPVAAGGVTGALIAWLVKRTGWLLVLAGLGIAIVALLGPVLPVAGEAILAGALLLTLAAGWLHVRSAADVSPRLWLFGRALAGLVAGGLVGFTLLHEERLDALPWLQLALLVLGVLASNRERVVRRQIFAPAGGAVRSRA